MCNYVACFSFVGRINLGSVIVDSTELRDQISQQNIALNPQIVNLLLNASLNASEVRTCIVLFTPMNC